VGEGDELGDRVHVSPSKAQSLACAGAGVGDLRCVEGVAGGVGGWVVAVGVDLVGESEAVEYVPYIVGRGGEGEDDPALVQVLG
jgi:hypothetical protein